MPCDYSKYTQNWPIIRKRILKRAKNCCERCGVKNYQLNPVTKSKVVLTIAHLDHDIQNNDEEKNLRALCQMCHNRHDARHRADNRKKRNGS
jgi:5-methylcytosine-specific restriction endonuclease McrA